MEHEEIENELASHFRELLTDDRRDRREAIACITRHIP